MGQGLPTRNVFEIGAGPRLSINDRPPTALLLATTETTPNFVNFFPSLSIFPRGFLAE